VLGEHAAVGVVKGHGRSSITESGRNTTRWGDGRQLGQRWSYGGARSAIWIDGFVMAMMDCGW
jgi:hypothetical protein